MPLYDFVCDACGAEFEELCGSGGEAPLCPKCGASCARRMISRPAPLKTGAFPYKVGPVHPMASKMAAGLNKGCPGCKD